jgi:uncharacterized protein YdcH (DUF465 family)
MSPEAEAEALMILQRMDARLDRIFCDFDELDRLFTRIERHMADMRVSFARCRNELPRPHG